MAFCRGLWAKGTIALFVAKRYTEEHEWVSLDTDTSVATISITKHASASLGDVVFVELPQIGKDIKAGGAYSSRPQIYHDFRGFTPFLRSDWGR